MNEERCIRKAVGEPALFGPTNTACRPRDVLVRLYLGKAKPQKPQRPGLLRNLGQRELEESILAPRGTKSPVRLFQYQKSSMLGLSLRSVTGPGTSPGGDGDGAEEPIFQVQWQFTSCWCHPVQPHLAELFTAGWKDCGHSSSRASDNFSHRTCGSIYT